MNRLKCTLLWLLAFCASSCGMSYAADDLSQYTLKDLRGAHHTSLAALQGDIVAVMFFEPGCSWCRKQALALKQLHQQCAKVAPVALGINGNRLALKKALFNLQFPFPGYQAPANLLKDLGGVAATPITLIFQHQQLIGAFRGYQTEAYLAQQVGCSTADSAVASH